MSKKTPAKKDFYSKETQSQARSGSDFWYKDIWKNVGKCVFCDLRKKYIIAEEQNVVLVANVFPYIDGHLMVVPRKHIVYAKELSSLEWDVVRMYMYLGKKIIRKALGVKSVWTVYREGPLGEESNKTVEHLHIHLIPYQKGLVTFNYQKILLPAEDLVKKLKSYDDYFNEKRDNFRKKYT